MKNLKNTLKSVMNFILTNERINSQRCVAQDLDTTVTILSHKKNF